MAVAARGLLLLFILIIIAVIGAVIAVVVSKSKGSDDAVETKDGSYFDGGYFAYIGYGILVGFVTAITLGIAFPWMCCLMQKWKAKHTVICGKRQRFDGTGIQLIGKYILWVVLTVITFGIYGFWMAIAIKKWITKHTHFVGEQDDNSYFDGGILGFIGTNILAALVTVVPFVGFAWSNVIKLRWQTKHTVIDSRRLIFVGTVGNFFLKYLIWGILSIITLGVFALFVPVKNLKLEAENTIDHEHTQKALMERSEYRNTVQNTVSANKNYTTEFEMEGLKAGINDTTDEVALRALADSDLRCAQYLYVTKYASEQYAQEPFCSMLKASAEAEYAPAMCLYALTNEMDENSKNEMLLKAAEQGQTKAVINRMNYYADAGLAENNLQTAYPLLKKAVFYADVLQASDVELSEQEQEAIKKCILKIRRIDSGKSVSTKGGAGVIAAVVCAVVLLAAIIIAFCALFFKAEVRSMPDTATQQNTVMQLDSPDYNGLGL